MSGKKKRKTGYRPKQEAVARPAPPAPMPERRQGLLGGLFGSPVPASLSPMPNYRRSLGRGFLLAGSTPALLLFPFLWTLVTWLTLQAFGYVGSPLILAQAVSLPPLAVSADLQAALVSFGQPTGIYAVLPMLLVRTALVAILAGMIVEGFEAGGVTLAGVAQGIRAIPVVFAAVVLSLLSVMASAVASQLGIGGSLVQILLPAAVLWLLGFVPFVAVTERRSLAGALKRSADAGRTPGGRQFLFALLYLLLLTLVQVFTPGNVTTANPGLSTWAFVLLVTYAHIAFAAAFGYRWLVVRESVPEPAARPVPSRR